MITRLSVAPLKRERAGARARSIEEGGLSFTEGGVVANRECERNEGEIAFRNQVRSENSRSGCAICCAVVAGSKSAGGGSGNTAIHGHNSGR